MPTTVGTTTNQYGLRGSTDFVIMAGTYALLAWYDGSNVVLSQSSSPYTSWSSPTTLISGARWPSAAYYDATTGDVYVLTVNGSNMQFHTLSESGGTWSTASSVTISSGDYGSSMNPAWQGTIVRGTDGDLWVGHSKWNGQVDYQIWYSANNGSSWTESTLLARANGNGPIGALSAMGLAGSDRMVVARGDAGGDEIGWYNRQDADGKTTWSSRASADPSSSGQANIWHDFNDRAHAAKDGNGDLVYVWGKGSGADCHIGYTWYRDGTNDWGNGGPLGASGNDSGPTLCTIPDGSGDLLCHWSSYQAPNDFDIVYRRYLASSRTWESAVDASPTTAANRRWPSAAVASTGYLITAWQEGTSSPWDINVEVVSFDVGGAPAGEELFPGAASVSATPQSPTVAVSNNVGLQPGAASASLTPQTPTVATPTAVSPANVSTSLTPFTATVLATANVVVTPGADALAITPFAPVVATPVVVTPGIVALALTAFAAAVATPTVVSPANLGLALTAFAAAVQATANRWVNPGAGALALTPFASTVSLANDFIPGPVSLALTAFPPLVSTPVGASPGAGALALTPFVPDVAALAGLVLTPGSRLVETERFAPNVIAPLALHPSPLSLSLTPFAPAVATPVAVTPAATALATTRFTPDVAATANVLLRPGAGSLVTARFVPLVVVTGVVYVFKRYDRAGAGRNLEIASRSRGGYSASGR